MIDEETYNQFLEDAKLMHSKHLSWDEIKENLEKIGASDVTSVDIVHRLKNMIYEQKRKVGLTFIASGALCLLLSFLYMCFTFNTQINFNYVLYGLTSAGLLLMLYGLYEMVG
jgi:hypothetical protein